MGFWESKGILGYLFIKKVLKFEQNTQNVTKNLLQDKRLLQS